MTACNLLVLIVLFLVLLRWHYSAMRTFSSLMELPQSALFFYLSFQFLILHLLISLCTQFHHLFFSRPLSRLPWNYYEILDLLFFNYSFY